MKLKLRARDDVEDLSRFVTFSGAISCADFAVPIRFRVRFGVDGELRFRVYPLPMTAASLALRSRDAGNKSSKLATYSISAVSAGGMRFESDGIVLKGTGIHSASSTTHVTLKLGYTNATFTRDQDNGDAPATIRWSLRGFECFPAVQGICSLGKVGMPGHYPEKGVDRVSGIATLQTGGPVVDIAAWIGEAERLFEHLRLIMSLAMSRQVNYPIRDIWAGGRWQRMAYSQTKSRRSYPHLFHPMLLQPAFDAALASHFNPPIDFKSLNYAIEWLTLQATYTEMRLTNVITALENLAN